MTHSKNEIVLKMREEFLKKRGDKWYYKNESNVFFVDLLIRNYGIKEVTSAGIEFLLELEKKEQLYLLDSESCGKPRNALNVLFTQSMIKGDETEIGKAVKEMCEKGNENCLFLLEIFTESATTKSVSQMNDIMKEINNGWKFSKQGDVKRIATKRYETRIQSLLDEVKPKLPLNFS